jgi:hypothetical protein
MKATFETDDPTEIKRISKANDMAFFIFHLQYNVWKDFEDSDIDYSPVRQRINELLDEYSININDLTE